MQTEVDVDIALNDENAERNERQKRNRWQMNRAGILNFWFYEEEEFELEDGRIVLRGTNGAGKSVTMQSFVPLVLDGDKRPHRLDPFGSKDRRIEYYLLGDKEEHSDRTGYLWLEFKHPVKNIYKTIGIGLRARRGMTQVNFWGFVLEDGRRINHDFWLYDQMLELEGQGKFPLDRKVLELAIGAGGQVVQEQRAYRELVNRSLFGFHDKDAYTDLLQLLVQLRSPKLSKDVKPTAIYDILVQALPPLQEEELRPLSEVMEDMDQLADRLEELKLHQSELDKISRSYEQYNRFILYQSGKQFMDAHAEHEDVRDRLASLMKELHGKVQEKTDTKAAQESAQASLLEADTELELLGRSEAMEKQQELEQTEQALQETEQYSEQSQKRLTAALRNAETAHWNEEKAKKLQQELLDMQQEGLEELDALASEMEFRHHGVYARYWSPQPPEELSFVTAWRRDTEEHRSEINEALKLAEQEREAGMLVAELDRQLGALRADRDQSEHEMRGAEERSEKALSEWKERLLEWKQSLRALRLDESTAQAMFAASGALSYERQAVEAVLQPVRSEAERQRQTIWREKLELDRQVDSEQADWEQLAGEKRAWEQSREPEPLRSGARTATRSKYGQAAGASLYEVCEFHPHVSAEQQASVELSLLNSGLLDAWIRPDGAIGTVNTEDEEVWISARPLDYGYTLADILRPAPSVDSGLTEQVVDGVLRSFAWGEVFDPSSIDEEQNPMVIGRDYYQFGSVVGKVNGEGHRAQFIGIEARKQFKLAEIARLEQEMQQCEDRLEELRGRIVELEQANEAVNNELALFPIHDGFYHEALLAAWKEQYERTTRFALLLEQENKMSEQLRAKEQHRAGLKQALIAATSNWTRLKSLAVMQEALRAIADYLEGISQLQSDWREYRQKSAEADKYEAEARQYTEDAELEEENRDKLLDKLLSLRVKTEQLRKLMAELGISDLHERISELKRIRVHQQEELKRLAEAMIKVESRIAVLKDRQSQLAEQEQDSEDKMKHRSRAFAEECRMQLVPEAAERELKGEAQSVMFGACQTVVAQLEPMVARANKERLSGVLQDQFNAAKHLLGEYVLEAEISEEGRITLLSMRDRTRPQKPASLLAEMGELLTEQESLLSEKDRELFEEIILRSVGKSIRQRIQRAELWMNTMNKLMAERDTSSGLKLQLQWLPKAAQSENELNSDDLVELLRRDAHLLHDDEVERLVAHFRSRVQWAKQGAMEEREALRKHIYEMLDYRSWFQFSLRYKKGEETQYRELTDARFNVLSGGEKAMSMYIPLFAATYSRYADASPDAPKIISLDEAFAGVDDENIRDLFGLLTEMDFDYMMTSQVLWGCYDTVPSLGISEIYRPKDANFVTVFRYRWNGRRLETVVAEGEEEQ
ncbi:TIGR02680 family protein [Paenibacillus sp. HB172176]|uniref:TIGR02680 family protein n=1 Tax=Paenibacillus sp. HB172176 TaxID=2493690 RepID=UPI00143BB87C|nr:TIGR02680 family protein [Paenibacillus sp. HB172176]